MTQSVIINGAFGKMGQATCRAIDNASNLSLRAELGKHDNLNALIQDYPTDIVIELTNANVVYQNTHLLLTHGIKTIVGASGLTVEQIETLSSIAQTKKVGCIIAPNFSIGAILMMRFASLAAKHFSEVEIIETHHQQKLDAPSGTAIKTAQLIEAARNQEKNHTISEEKYPGARGAKVTDTQIHSLRLPGYIASQQVCFGGTGENLTISHNSISRDCFMPGILLACQKIQTLNHLVYGLEKFID